MKEPTKTTDRPTTGGPRNTREMTPEETRQAERDAAYNRQQTSGYDASKGPSGKGRPKGKRVVEDVSDDEIREAIQTLVESFQGRADKTQVVNVMRTAAELLNRSESWVRDPNTLDYDPDDLDDPRANPMGLRPSPKTATRADEHTAPEPDSMGHIADRLAARAGLDEEDEDVSDVPPVDQDAVAAKRAAQKSVDEFGTAGGMPTTRAEHKDDPKPKKK